METKTDIRRRNFLRTVGVGTAGAAAAVIGAKTMVEPAAPAAETDAKAAGKGYRVTEHINNYYRTTRV